jgi:O-antigen/teichoic acid export membrane protein
LQYISKLFKSNFLKESIIYGVTGVLSRFSIFLTIPIYTRYLSVEDFGILDLYVTIGMLLYIVFEMQIVSGFMRNYYEQKNEGKLRELIGTTLTYYFLTYFIVFLLIGLNSDLNIIDMKYILPLVLLVLPKQIFDLNNLILRMESKPYEYLVYNLFGLSLVAISGILAVIYIEASVNLVLWSMFLSNIVLGGFALLSIVKRVLPKFGFYYLKELLYYSVPIVPAVLGVWLMSAIGRIYISEYLSVEDLGIYSLALKISMIYMLFTQAFKMAWDPYIFKKLNDIDIKDIVAKTLNIYLGVGIIVASVIYILTPTIISIIATEKYISAKNYVFILLVAYFWQGAINIVSLGNVWVKKTYYNSYGNIIGGMVVLLATSLLIEIIGALGAGISFALGVIISFLIILFYAQKNIIIKYNLLYIFILIALSLVYILLVSLS